MWKLKRKIGEQKVARGSHENERESVEERRGTRARQEGRERRYWGMKVTNLYSSIEFIYKYVTINPTVKRRKRKNSMFLIESSH